MGRDNSTMAINRLVLAFLGVLPYPVIRALAWLDPLVVRVFPGHYLWLLRRTKLI
uniref:Uncharacterized protein n=1 Tax=bacterium enrichment culture clone fosmid MGS-K1 TaxID=1549356 RepID=A0A0B5KNQ5_9BACT|nr:hypothetical protein [bacterium enrichment culture clone fosmid MGS-K1]